MEDSSGTYSGLCKPNYFCQQFQNLYLKGCLQFGSTMHSIQSYRCSTLLTTACQSENHSSTKPFEHCLSKNSLHGL